MEVSVERLLQIIGEEHTKVSLLEEEVGRLRKVIERLTKEKDEQANQSGQHDFG